MKERRKRMAGRILEKRKGSIPRKKVGLRSPGKEALCRALEKRERT